MDEPTAWRPLTAQEARELGWRPNPSGGPGRVTQPYDEWRLVDADLRAYLKLTLGRMTKVFEAEWDDVMHSPADEDFLDPESILIERLGMSLWDWEWMTLAAVVRDAVSAYEVYVVRAYQEVLRTHRVDVTRLTPTPRFGEAKTGSALLGLDVRPEALRGIFDLRNVLTHQRGQLRTKQERERFSEDQTFSDRIAHLTEEKVTAVLNSLRDVVHDLDPVFWAYTWTRRTAPPLLA